MTSEQFAKAFGIAQGFATIGGDYSVLAEAYIALHNERFSTRLPLTAHQKQVLDFVTGFTAEHGYAPSFTEIADNFGYRSLGTVHEHLDHIEKKGWIERWPEVVRGIRVLEGAA